MGPRITAGGLPDEAPDLARFLIGASLVHEISGSGRIVARIVETEAYLADDPASHSFRGRTRRNAAMFLPRGHAYCYLSYGCWTALNVSSGPEGHGEAVLIRAAEIVEGAGYVAKAPRLSAATIASGPGRLGRALHITLGHDGIDLCSDAALYLATGPRPAGEIRATPRIGITKAADLALRFIEVGSSALSGPRRLNR